MYTVEATVSWVPGKRVVGLSGAVSFALLEMNSFGSSGGGALVGAKDGEVAPVPVGREALAGRFVGLPDALSSPFAETTAMATAVPTATVASAPPPMSSRRLRLLRVSDASASAAQSGVCSSTLPPHGCCELGFQGSHWDWGPPVRSSWVAS